MYARVVRFTEVTAERISEIVAQVEEREGPPPGVDATGIELFVDKAQGMATFVGYLETAEDARRERGPRRDGSVGDPRHAGLR